MAKNEDGDYKLGGSCDHGVIGKILVGVVLVAAWFSDFGGRRR